MRRVATLVLGVVLLGAVAATAAPGAAPAPRLKAFAGCPELVGYARKHGSALPVAAARAGVQPAPAVAADGGGGAVEHSTTNVQEAGVDEPDIVKSDGKRILAIAQGKLQYVDVAGARPRLRGSLALDGASPYALLVDGDRALVFANGRP